jgi:predicted RecA/RadA family phage recombinase
MRNFVQHGDSITVTAPYALTSGQGALVGAGLFGVAASDAANGAEVVIKTTGVFEITALGTDTAAIGTKLYWDNTNRRLTTTASTHVAVGFATAAKTSGPTTATVLLALGTDKA